MSKVTHTFNHTWLYALAVLSLCACTAQAVEQPVAADAPVAQACMTVKNVLDGVPSNVKQADHLTGADAKAFVEAAGDTDPDDEILVMQSEDTDFVLFFSRGCFTGETKLPHGMYKVIKAQLLGVRA